MELLTQTIKRLAKMQLTADDCEYIDMCSDGAEIPDKITERIRRTDYNEE